jgi:predicted amino acid racemase
MTARATVTIDLAKITENARSVCDRLPGVEVVGVTKVTCGSPEVARAMFAGGVSALGDSRLENIEGLRDAGVPGPYWLLRSPTPELAVDTVRLADVSLASEVATLEALDAAAGFVGAPHSIVAMLDLGDLREGMMPSELPAFLDRAAGCVNVEVLGLGVSLTCYGAIVPSEENLGQLVALVEDAERTLDKRLVVSGGMSSSIELAMAGNMPARVDNLRIGESILLGVSTVTREPLAGLHTDAIVLEAPVIECALKPSVPVGECAQDAFGGCPTFEDRGERMRAICAIGRQDAPPEGLVPLDAGVEILGASSDHLILDVDAMVSPPRVGDGLRFRPNYAATLRLFTSPYVEKVYRA